MCYRVVELACDLESLLGDRALGPLELIPLAPSGLLGQAIQVGPLLALGLATILRHTAGAISGFVGVLFILPLIAQALPSSVRDGVGKFLPATIGARLTAVVPGFRSSGSAFSPWIGHAILGGYAVVALGVGARLLQRRDA